MYETQTICHKILVAVVTFTTVLFLQYIPSSASLCCLETILSVISPKLFHIS